MESTVGTATIHDNLIDLYEKNGPTVDNTGSFAQIDHNEIHGAGPTTVVAQNGIQVGRGAAAKVDHNLVTDNVYTPSNAASGLILFDYGSLQVDHNDLLRNDTGIYLDGQGGVFEQNNAFDGTWGIYAESTSSDNDINHNEARRNSQTGPRTPRPGGGCSIEPRGRRQGDANRPGLVQGRDGRPVGQFE